MAPRLKRVLIKLSGESLSKNGRGIQVNAILPILNDIKTLNEMGLEIALVVGGGNILRGAKAKFHDQIERSTADSMGMLATMINALALKDIMNANGLAATVLSARSVDGILQTASVDLAHSLIEAKKIVIYAGGTGNPFVTTDSTASLRACEIKADALLKLTTVDGVFDKDPNQYQDARCYGSLSFDEVLEKHLAVMDLAAFIQCRDFNIPICVLNMHAPHALVKAVSGQPAGTWVRNEERAL